ncbi:hypothetical protein [Streptomyces sp. BHT-5-2]|uniref:hypothetical protein n=1 Tax=Streptomyces sp. BHT-5-2 TaxID=2866715 RepID=UPI0028C3FCAA|nr:hypothetical protein [Streptomyces sp. BHT-5-2]
MPLRDGTLVSKRRALAVLPGTPPPSPDRTAGAPEAHRADWPLRRAELPRAFLGPAIDRTLAAYGSD